MNISEPDDVIERLFEEFMADQEARLSPETYLQYAGTIDLLDLYLDRYSRSECSRRESNAPIRFDERFRGLPAAVDLVGRFSEFLSDFLPREIGAGAVKLRVARRVIKSLGAWLAAKGYIIGNPPAPPAGAPSRAGPPAVASSPAAGC